MTTLLANLEALDQGENWIPISDKCEQIFTLFEGACPDCGKETTMVGKGGTPKFHSDHPFDGYGDIHKQVWDVENDLLVFADDEGCVEFKCENDHIHVIGYSYGDWH